MKQFFTIWIISTIAHIGYSQYIPINLQQKTEYSELIVEGEIIAQTTFLNNIDGYIYTKNKLRPAKILKGKLQGSKEIEIITRGGELNGITETWSHLLKLKKSDYGIFFLNSKDGFGENAFTTFSSGQGFLRFFRSGNTTKANDFLKKPESVNQIYKELHRISGEQLKIIDSKNSGQKSQNCLNIVIDPIIFSSPSESTSLGLSISAYLEELPLYLSDIKIVINYNSSQLGENVISSGVVEIDYGDELSIEDYDLEATDFSSNSIEIRITSNSDQAELILIDGFLKELLQATITFPDEIVIPDISISEEQIIEGTTLINPETGLATRLNCVEIKRPTGTAACPVISTISPKSVAAGVDDVSLSGIPGKITIRGSDFGIPSVGYVKPHLSDVLFYDVDLGWFPAGELEYISWSDTKIEVRVPTMIKSGSNSQGPGASTGRIGVFVTDFITGDYRCNYKINVREVASSSHGRIFRGNLPTGLTGTTMMRGNSSTLNCDASNDVDSPVTQFSVIINEQVLDTLDFPGVGTFMFNISDTIPSDTATIFYTDFQRTMIHELGHCFQLRHTNNKLDIMASGKIAFPRFNNFNRALTVNDDLGAKHIQALKSSGACSNGAMSNYVCSTSTQENEVKKQFFVAYPNPTNESLKLKIEASNQVQGVITLELIDLNGKKVLSESFSHFSELKDLSLPLDLPNGVYILRLFGLSGENYGFTKIILQR